MPKKLNKAGNLQEYVPAGNGDASGEYGDGDGNNVHFKSFKKPSDDVDNNDENNNHTNNEDYGDDFYDDFVFDDFDNTNEDDYEVEEIEPEDVEFEEDKDKKTINQILKDNENKIWLDLNAQYNLSEMFGWGDKGELLEYFLNEKRKELNNDEFYNNFLDSLPTQVQQHPTFKKVLDDFKKDFKVTIDKKINEKYDESMNAFKDTLNGFNMKIQAIMNFNNVDEEKAKEFYKNIQDYTGGYWFKDLIKGDKGALEMQKVLDDFIDKSPKFKGVVYKGLHFKGEDDWNNFLSNLTTSKSLKVVNSSSKKIEVAKSFAKNGEFGVIISWKNKKSGTDITGYSGFGEDESEVLIRSGTKLKNISVNVIGKIAYVTAEEDDGE